MKLITLQDVLAKLDAIFSKYKSTLSDNLRKSIICNKLDSNFRDVEGKCDIEYEVLSLDTSTIIDDPEKSELIEKA